MTRSYKSFEETFRILLEKAKKGSVSIETILTILGGRGKVLLLIFLSLGFGQIPGVVLFLGWFIAYLGLRIAIDKSFIWMPKFFLHKTLPSYFLIKIINQILKFLRFMKRWAHPRYTWETHQPTTRMINGFMISLVGISLALSPPIPLTGWIAYVAIFSIGIGILNEDGIYLVVGYVLSVVYFVTVLFLLKFFSLQQIIHYIRS